MPRLALLLPQFVQQTPQMRWPKITNTGDDEFRLGGKVRQRGQFGVDAINPTLLRNGTALYWIVRERASRL